jgi:hypothetical protein
LQQAESVAVESSKRLGRLRPGAHHGVALLAGVLVVKTCVSIWEAK